jgi:hypothetical protein
MKKIVFLITFLAMVCGVAKAQESKVSVNGPEIEFVKTVHDYGEIPYNGNGECEFVFTNTGNEPLIVQKPKSSCGCTVPSWPKEPILPGESDVIKVTYKTTRVGNINKSITVTSNAKTNSTVVLRIKGKVLEQPNGALPEKEAGSPVNN